MASKKVVGKPRVDLVGKPSRKEGEGEEVVLTVDLDLLVHFIDVLIHVSTKASKMK